MEVISYEQHTVGSEGISVDLILWRRFKRPVPGLVELTLELAENQHLEHCGFVLPLGTVVTVPVVARPTRTTSRVISLWD